MSKRLFINDIPVEPLTMELRREESSAWEDVLKQYIGDAEEITFSIEFDPSQDAIIGFVEGQIELEKGHPYDLSSIRGGDSMELVFTNESFYVTIMKIENNIIHFIMPYAPN